MLRKALDWIDKKEVEAIEDENEKRGLAKAVGLGALEGTLNGFAVVGALTMIWSTVELIVNRNKN